MARRNLDFYPTPEWATNVLLDRCAMKGVSVFEPCVGDGAIARVLEKRFRQRVLTGDIDPVWSPMVLGDANDCGFWEQAERTGGSEIDWVITNPPFNEAASIVPIAYNRASIGIAMLLRLSFLEPVEDRGAWLNKHPPTQLIVLPRISFTGNGKTDSVTCAWMVWEKNETRQRIIVAENPKFTRRELQATIPSTFSAGIMTADIGPLP